MCCAKKPTATHAWAVTVGAAAGAAATAGPGELHAYTARHGMTPHATAAAQMVMVMVMGLVKSDIHVLCDASSGSGCHQRMLLGNLLPCKLSPWLSAGVRVRPCLRLRLPACLPSMQCSDAQTTLT